MSQGKQYELFKRMFSCDSARILKFDNCGMKRMFLLIGRLKFSYSHIRSAAAAIGANDDLIPTAYQYLDERVVASGGNHKELLASARTYKRVGGGI